MARTGSTPGGEEGDRERPLTAQDASVAADSALPGPGAFMGPVRRLAVNGIEIGYRQFGRGSDLVLLTGDGCTMTLWGTEFPRSLTAHFRVTALDNRGAGWSSDDPSAPLTISLLASDTTELIEALGLREPDLLGWSMGGEVGLTMAVRHPDVFRRLVTTGADAGGPHAIPASPAVDEVFATPGSSVEQLVDVLFPPAATAAKQRFVAECHSIPQERIAASGARRQNEAEAAFATYEETWRGLPATTTPILVTNGSEDVVAPPGNADVIVERVGPRFARKAIFEGAGHGMWFEEMDAFVALVRRFLTEPAPVADGRVEEGARGAKPAASASPERDSNS